MKHGFDRKMALSATLATGLVLCCGEARAQRESPSVAAMSEGGSSASVRPIGTGPGTVGVWWVPGRGVTFVRHRLLELRLGGYGQFIARTNQDDQGTHLGEVYFQRLRPELTGHLITPWITFRVNMEFGSGTPSGDTRPVRPLVAPPVFAPSPYLLDAYVNIAPWTELGLRVGQYKTPFSRAFIMTAQDTSFTDFSLVTRAFIPNRDIGGDLRGSFLHGRLGYNVGVYKGGGRLDQIPSNYSGFLVLARVQFQPLAPLGEDEADFTGGPLRVHIGANVLHVERHYGPGMMPPSGLPANYQDTTLGAEFALKFRGLSVYNEAYVRQREPAMGNASFASGLFSHLGYCFFDHRFEVAVRYSFMRPQMYETSNGTPSLTGGTDAADRHIFEAIFNVFFDENRYKIAGQYRYDSSIATSGSGSMSTTQRVSAHEFFLFFQTAL